MSGCRDKMLNLILRWTPLVLASQDEEGRFRKDDDWGTLYQNVIHPLALLYKLADERNPYFKDHKVLEAVVKAGDLNLRLQNDLGQLEFFSRGASWGWSYIDWNTYFWLEALRAVGDDLGSSRAESWRGGIRLAMDGIYRDFSKTVSKLDFVNGDVHNLFVWRTLLLYKAGGYFGEGRWVDEASEIMGRVARAQRIDGHWNEGGGPTTLYNYTTTFALGVYYQESGDERVLPALARATEFQRTFTYPDGKPVETIDGRVKYTRMVFGAPPPIYSLFPDGRSYLEFLIDRLLERPVGYCDDQTYVFHIYAFYGDILRYCQDGEASPWRRIGRGRMRGLEALYYADSDWCYFLSGIAGTAHENRFIQERQNLLSIWHRKTGLIVGGGNGRGQPELSTFEAIGDGRAIYMPTDGKVFQGEDGDRAELSYGEAKCQVLIPRPKTNRLQAQFSRHGEGRAIARLVLILDVGRELKVGEKTQILSAEPVAFFLKAGERAIYGGWSISADVPCCLKWPILPFNPYKKDGSSPLADAFGTIEADLWREHDRVAFAIEVG
jgi:hypothetical protein